MQMRIARHTHSLEIISTFYQEIVGLELRGGFTGHEGYHGIFLGMPGQNWELEFTWNGRKPEIHGDPEDALVFYISSHWELGNILTKIQQERIPFITPLNPYWQKHGYSIHDPDGNAILFSYREISLNANDATTQKLKAVGLLNWNDFLEYVRRLPYGRNSHRSEPTLCINEQKGTCSTKHALIKYVAEENGIPGIDLVLGIYKMHSGNTPGVEKVLNHYGIEYIPEAHCYVRWNQRYFDATTLHADIHRIRQEVLLEEIIQAEQVDVYKPQWHQAYLRQWILEQGIPFSFEQIWRIREECISAISAKNE